MTQAPSSNSTVETTDAQSLAELVCKCVDDGQPLVDYGVAHGGLGHPPPQQHVKLTQRAAGSGILEHYERDMAVRVSAGATMGQLQSALIQQNQIMPIDADDDITIGEIIYHNVYGPMRQSFGAARDLLLGLHYIDGQGRDIHVGGRTVKNVAGYDVTKLLVGSLGELGIVHEATLKTSAVPQHVLAVELSVDDPAAIDKTLPDWLLSTASPARMTLALRNGTWSVDLAYLGSPGGCAAQFKALKALQGDAVQSHTDRSYDDELADATAKRAWRRACTALVKVIVPPAQTGAICKALAAHQGLTLDAMPTHGCIFAGGSLDGAQAKELDELINRSIAPHDGQRAWYARPDGAEPLEPIAPQPTEWPLLIKLKRTMDPAGIFNPNRFLPAQDVTA